MEGSDFLSIVAVLVAFFSLIAQIYVGKKDVGTNLYQHVTTLFNNINEPFLQYPELRPYFYDGRDPAELSGDDHSRAIVIAEMIMDTFEWVVHDIKRATKVDKESWQEYMISIYSSSSIVKDFHDANPSWHPLFEDLLKRKGIR